jgi:hypothetical protein
VTILEGSRVSGRFNLEELAAVHWRWQVIEDGLCVRCCYDESRRVKTGQIKFSARVLQVPSLQARAYLITTRSLSIRVRVVHESFGLRRKAHLGLPVKIWFRVLRTTYTDRPPQSPTATMADLNIDSSEFTP